MSSHESLLLVRMMRYQGLLSDGELERVISLAEESNGHRELLERLLAEKLVDLEWAGRIEEYIVSRARSRAAEPDELFRLDRRFGQLALSRGWIQLADLEDALLEQERLRRRNLYFRVGEILVRLQAMTVERVREILKEQGCATLRCESCRKMVTAERNAPTTCSCGGALAPPVFLELVNADS